MRRSRGYITDDAGMVTVETAIGIAAVISVVCLCVMALIGVSDHIRCVDAAREAARLVARGDPGNARAVMERVAPQGAQLRITQEAGTVEASVSYSSTYLLGVNLGAHAVAALEPVAGAK